MRETWGGGPTTQVTALCSASSKATDVCGIERENQFVHVVKFSPVSYQRPVGEF
jgi:hypothetical protein